MSEASGTLTEVIQLKISNVCLLSSKQSNRDTIRVNNSKLGMCRYGASEASDILLGVDNWVMLYMFCSFYEFAQSIDFAAHSINS